MKEGFSFFELLIAIAVASCLVALIGLFSQDVFGIFGQMAGTKAINDTIKLTRITLSSDDQCTLNLQNLPLDMSSLQGVEVPSISTYDLKTKTASSLMTKEDQNINGVVIQSIRLLPVKLLEVGLMYSELQFSFKLPGKLGDQAALKRSLPLMVRLAGGKVASCWIRADSVQQEADQVCSQVTSGVLNSYNSATGSCALASGKWFNGDPYNATCPQNAFLAPNANANWNCSYVMGDSYVDPTSTTFQFSDGTTGDIYRSPAVVSLDPTTSTCHCDWGIDISPADIAAARCQILCISP